MVAALFFHKFRFIGLQQESKQWGRANGSGEVRITLPISFTMGGYALIATPTSSANWAVVAASISTNQIQINTPTSVYWLVGGK